MSTITPKPVYASDAADQSRDAIGLNRWSRKSRTVDFIMSVLGWFTITVEVFLRRDFGQRWFTPVNYYAGLFLLLILAILQYLVEVIANFFRNLIEDIIDSLNPFYEPEGYEMEDSLMDHSLFFILLLYLLLGGYHLFKIWWRNQSNTALHSYYDGTSRLEPLGGGIMQLLNIITAPVVKLCLWLVPKKQRIEMPQPALINNRAAFTNTVIEPLVLLLLAVKLEGMISLWLFVSSVALAIHASWRETARLNKVLDFRDSILDAQAMMQLRNDTQQPNPEQEVIRQAAITLRDNPQVITHMHGQYPDLMDIIEEMNGQKAL